CIFVIFIFNAPPTTEIYTLSLHDALPISLKKVMEEIEDEIKETFSEHQLKIEMIQIMEDELNDLSGANKPVEVKLFGPDQRQLRKLAEDVGEALEKKPKIPGIKEINTNVRAGNPDLMIRLDGSAA